MTLATTLLPAERAEWAAAMQAELQSMDNRRSAWFWALGCLRAGLSERLRAHTFLDNRAIRWTVALWLMYRAGDLLCNVGFILTYKDPHWGLQRLFGDCAQDKDYQRLIPFLDSTTYGTLGAWLLISAIYALAIGMLLRRTSYATHVFLMAAALNVVCWARELSEPLFVNAFPLSDHLWDALLYGGTLLLGWICWANSRKSLTL
jgi:hypothetical protein